MELDAGRAGIVERVPRREVPTHVGRWVAFLPGSPAWLFPERSHRPANLEWEAVARRQKMRALVADSQRSSSDPLFQKASARDG